MSTRSRVFGVPIVLSLCLLQACQDDDLSQRSWAGSRTLVGDTVVTTTRHGFIRSDSNLFQTSPPLRLWTGVAFDAPAAIVHLDGGRLAVADQSSIIVGDMAGTILRKFGRRGRGPGEFQRIGGIADVGGDTLLIWDVVLQRLTFISTHGQVARSVTLSSLPGFTTALPVDLHLVSGSLILAWQEGVTRLDIPTAVAYSGFDIRTSAHIQLASIDGLTMTEAGSGVYMPKYPFGGRALYAVSTSGKLAYSDGVEYCVTVLSPMSRQHEKVCVEGSRPDVVADARSPTPIEASENDIAFLEAKRRVQVFGKKMNSIAAIRFDTSNRLWVRTVAAEQKFDAMIMRRFPEFRPETFFWDVFDDSGRRLVRFSIDSAFDPLLIDATSILGVLETESGERVLARVAIPAVFAPQ